jgi:hypothetical protein
MPSAARHPLLETTSPLRLYAKNYPDVLGNHECGINGKSSRTRSTDGEVRMLENYDLELRPEARVSSGKAANILDKK